MVSGDCSIDSISGLGHTEDTIPESVTPRGIKQQLDAVRDMKLELVKEWLGWYSEENIWNTTGNTPVLMERNRSNPHHSAAGRSFGSPIYLCLGMVTIIMAVVW